MNKETEAIITILIAEIKSCKNMDEITQLLESWITANDLHPEDVRTYSSIEELKQAMESEIVLPATPGKKGGDE